ncbi:TPA: hypothetical protein ACHXP8_003709, partial [Shigella sonnei]
MVTLKAHILPHPDLQPPGCRGSASKRRNYQAFTTTPNARFWHKADAHSHANALPLTCQQPYRLLRNYGFLL